MDADDEAAIMIMIMVMIKMGVTKIMVTMIKDDAHDFVMVMTMMMDGDDDEMPIGGDNDV